MGLRRVTEMSPRRHGDVSLPSRRRAGDGRWPLAATTNKSIPIIRSECEPAPGSQQAWHRGSRGVTESLTAVTGGIGGQRDGRLVSIPTCRRKPGAITGGNARKKRLMSRSEILGSVQKKIFFCKKKIEEHTFFSFRNFPDISDAHRSLPFLSF